MTLAGDEAVHHGSDVFRVRATFWDIGQRQPNVYHLAGPPVFQSLLQVLHGLARRGTPALDPHQNGRQGCLLLSVQV